MQKSSAEDIRLSRFDQGLRVVTERLPYLRSIAFSIWLKAGSRYESADINGVSHFIEHLVFKGTDNLLARDISQLIDEMGGNANAFTSREEISFYIKILDTEIKRGVNLLSDIILKPAFRKDDFELERKVILEEIRMTEDTPEEYISDNFFLNFWLNQAIGRPVQGTKEIITSLTIDEIKNNYKKILDPRRIVVAAVGNCNHEEIVNLLENNLMQLTAAPDPVNELQSPSYKPFFSVYSKPHLEQARFIMGCEGVSIKDDDRYTVHLLSTLLGGNSSSRLFHEVREERGLVYDISAASYAYEDSGMFMITAGSKLSSIPEVLKIIKKEILKLIHEPPSNAELSRIKNFVKGNMVLILESASARMSRHARHVMYFDKTYTLDEIIEKVDAVTSEDILRISSRLMRGRWSIALLKPKVHLSIAEELLNIDV